MTDQYAVIGNPIAHSKSPRIHAEFARQTGQAMSYVALLAPLDQFVETVQKFVREGGKGLNVTVPFKQAAYQLATRLTERAQLAGAVNTLKFEGQTILGDNTDGAGLVKDIRENLEYSIAGKDLLLMGAGGAVRGVILPLMLEKPNSVTIANRTLQKAHDLARHFAPYGNVRASDYAGLAGERFDLVINGTSSSLNGEVPPLPPRIMAPGAMAYDLMYGKGLTAFLALAETQGAARLADGLGMLVEQAADSFYLWRGRRPETKPVIDLLRAGM